MATSQDFVNWICSEHLNHDFLKYLFLAEGDDLLRFASGAIHQTIYFPEAKAFHVCHPNIAEQRRLVEILNTITGGIGSASSSTESSLRAAPTLLDSRLQELFTQRGAGWTLCPLPELATHSLGKMLDKVKNVGILRPYLRNINVRWFEFDLSDLREMRVRESESAKYTASKGDVLVCEGGYPGRAAIWTMDEPIHFQKALHRVRFRTQEHAKWFIYFLYSLSQSGQIKRHFSGSGIQHLTGESMSRLLVPVPPLEELVSHLRLLDDLAAEIKRVVAIYTQKRGAVHELRQSLLHHAFTGQL